MDWRDARFSMPLGERPRIKQIAVSVHGTSGKKVEHFRVPGLWCLHLYRYEATLRIDDAEFPIRPGHAGVTPPGAELAYHMRGRSQHLYVHFALSGRRGAGAVEIPVMQDLGHEFPACEAAASDAMRWFAQRPFRAEVRLWDVLFRLAERGAPAPDAIRIHPQMQMAMEWIERHLAEPITVAAVAKQAGLSHNHLTRLCRAATGATAIAYLRRCRVQRARHLILNSTLPIKAVAAQVGLPDLQQFNKVVRAELGVSPRQLRKCHGV